jgi:membrane associated rhomboid family serine protease
MSPDDLPPGAPSSAPRAREPIFDAPVVVVALVAFLIAIQAIRVFLPEAVDDWIVYQFAFVPSRITFEFWPQSINAILERANFDAAALEQARNLRAFLPMLQDGPKLWTVLTYSFLHASWVHVGLNSIWIVAFGPPVARRLGSRRFLALFAVTAVAGGLVHWAFNAMDFSPLIGASAADSGLMAASARFIFQPGGPLGGPGDYSRMSSTPNYRAPAPPLLKLLRERRVAIFLLIWLVTNFIFGAGAQRFGLSEAPVAWLAHMGGFAAGLFLFPLFDPRPAVFRR